MKYFIYLLLFSFVSCSSVKKEEIVIKPKIEIVDSTPSWDGNEQNSGVINFVAGKGALITPRAAARYNALIVKYGTMFIPILKEGDGLTPEGENFFLDSEHVVKFAEMNRKHKNL